jgi:hypothetical protein
MKFCKLKNDQIVNLDHIERVADRETWLELILTSGFTVKIEDADHVQAIRKVLENCYLGQTTGEVL